MTAKDMAIGGDEHGFESAHLPTIVEAVDDRQFFDRQFVRIEYDDRLATPLVKVVQLVHRLCKRSCHDVAFLS